MDDPPSPLLFICWACRSGNDLACEGWCEHVIVGRVDGRLVLCPALPLREDR